QDEAARRLRLTPGAIKGRLERGRARLATRLTRRGIAPVVLLTLAGGLTLPRDLMGKALDLAQPGAMVPTSIAALIEGSSLPLLRLIAGVLLLVAAGGFGIVALVPAKPPAESRPPEKAEPKAEAKKTDSVGDLLPEGAIARVGSVRLRHGDR